MKEIYEFWQGGIKWAAAFCGVIAGWYGGWPLGTRVLLALMALDYILGLACAFTGHSPKTETGHFLSKVAFEGLTRKGVIMAVILVAALLDRALGGSGDALPPTAMFRSAAEFFYIASEGLSIVENAGLMGVPVPRALRQALEALREKKDAPDKPPDPEA